MDRGKSDVKMALLIQEAGSMIKKMGLVSVGTQTAQFIKASGLKINVKVRED